MVGPYLSGQRAVIAGYVHRVRDLALHSPAEAFSVLGLGFEGSEFRPDMPELFFLCWNAREIDGYVPVSSGGRPPEFYLEAIQIPVGTTLCKLTLTGDEPVSRYDGLAWRRIGTALGPGGSREGGARRALPADGLVSRYALSGGRRSFRLRGHLAGGLAPA
jgi:hypothetical protein